MADEQVIKLLEEIRDLQRESAANYKQALENQKLSMQNQQQSIAMQKTAIQRSKAGLVLVFVLFLFLGLTYFVPMFAWVVSWVAQR